MHVVEMLNGLGRWLMGHLWQLSIELVVLAVVVMLAIFVLRIKSPALRHVFWGLVLIKPVVTLLVASPVSLYAFLGSPAPEPVVVQPEARAEAEDPNRAGPAAATPARTEPATSEKAPVLAPAMTKLGLHGAIGLAWLVIASALGLRLLMGCAFVALLRHSATLQRDGPLHAALQEASRELKLRRRVGIATTGAVPGPVLTGVLRAVILLPQHVAEGLSRRQIRMIVMHELVHVRRWDNLVVLLQRLAEICLFFHPVIWLCGWMMRREAEAACDDAVLASTGGSELYADSLTRVAEMTVGRPPVLLASASATAESHFAHRVRRILDGGVGRMTIRVTIVSVIALVAVACLALPRMLGQKATSEQRELSAALARRAGLLESFEGYVTVVCFHNPETPHANEAPDHAGIKFYVMDEAHDRWLLETRWQWSPQEGRDRPLPQHTALIRNEGTEAKKWILDHETKWIRRSRPGSHYPVRSEFMQKVLFLRRLGLPRAEHVSVTNEEVDGVPCRRLAGELRQEGPGLKSADALWVDPAKGFAVRKYAWALYRGRRPIAGEIGHAYDLREHEEGLWLPGRTRIVRYKPHGDQGWTWDEVSLFDIQEAKVNQALSQDFFSGFVFKAEYNDIPYEPRIVDTDPGYIKLKEALLKRLAEGPGGPANFVEELPELKFPAEEAVPEEAIPPAATPELTPAQVEERDRQRQRRCLNNMKQLLLGLLMYCEQGNPLRPTWVEDISPYVRNDPLFRCPSRQELKVGFALNQALLGLTLADIARPAETVLLFESNVGGDGPVGGASHVPDDGVHNGGIHVGFANGHGRWVPVAEAKKLLEASDESAQ